jgi:hypothetical protein
MPTAGNRELKNSRVQDTPMYVNAQPVKLSINKYTQLNGTTALLGYLELTRQDMIDNKHTTRVASYETVYVLEKKSASFSQHSVVQLLCLLKTLSDFFEEMLLFK